MESRKTTKLGLPRWETFPIAVRKRTMKYVFISIGGKYNFIFNYRF